MKISRNWLQTYFEREIPTAEKLAELFTFHFCEIESLDESISSEKTNDGKVYEIKDDVLDLKVLPDRAHYALCHKGAAGEVALLTRQPLKPRWFLKSLPKVSSDKIHAAKIEDAKFCRRYTGRYLEISKVEPSSLWMDTALTAIGQKAINSVVDATNYIMFDIGQPLHAFDADKIKGDIVIRAAKEGEKIILLDDREIILTPDDHVIADDLGALDIAGVKGGKRAEISSTTRNILLTSCNFDPTMVRRTSTKYNLRNEASKRFENELTPELASQALDHLSAIIAEIYPDAKFGPIVDEYPVKAKQTVIEFDPNYIEERLGVKVPLDEVKQILEGMRIIVSVGAASRWSLTIPYERLDLIIKEDIVEEVGRIYGYDHVIGILPPTTNEKTAILPSFYLSEKIKNILVDQGFSEVSLYTLVEKGDIETAKPLAKDKAFARKNLSDGMMNCVEKNTLNADLLGLEAIKVFEIGHVFNNESEEIHLVLGAVQVKKVKGLNSETIVNEAVKKLESELGVTLKGQILKNKTGNYSVYEIDLEPIIKTFRLGTYEDLNLKPSSINRYEKFSLYPFIVRDIAIFVPESVAGENLWKVIEKGIGEAKATELLVRHSLFDTFKKEEKVSYAFRLVFQSMERTLTDDEANKIMEIIYDGLKKEGWEVR
ncbi:MAG: phenylalanine--tRNA ligase subunit beta [Candidatus Taylorbacteria bacterium]|nr:phenylalanine--tRNA ligase subunit beta [Candidatus Taylorbacteria bacterium]